MVGHKDEILPHDIPTIGAPSYKIWGPYPLWFPIIPPPVCVFWAKFPKHLKMAKFGSSQSQKRRRWPLFFIVLLKNTYHKLSNAPIWGHQSCFITKKSPISYFRAKRPYRAKNAHFCNFLWGLWGFIWVLLILGDKKKGPWVIWKGSAPSRIIRVGFVIFLLWAAWYFLGYAIFMLLTGLAWFLSVRDFRPELEPLAVL